MVELWDTADGRKSIMHQVVSEVQTNAEKMASHNACILQTGKHLDYLRQSNIFEDVIVELNDM